MNTMNEYNNCLVIKHFVVFKIGVAGAKPTYLDPISLQRICVSIGSRKAKLPTTWFG